LGATDADPADVDGAAGILRAENPRRGALEWMGSGRGAAWLARLLGVQEVPSSNLGGPTKNPSMAYGPFLQG
jgi:hypothetical protein